MPQTPTGDGHHHGVVEVEVNLPAAKKDEDKGVTGTQDTTATVDEHTAGDSTAPATNYAWPAWLMWALFCLGWVLMPCWWLVTAAGLTTSEACPGHANQGMFRRRTGMTGSQRAAWWCSTIMTVAGVIALVLGCAIHFGAVPAQQEVPVYYLSLSGPADAFPTFSPNTLALVSRALHSALALPDPVFVDVFLAAPPHTPTLTTASGGRRRLQAASGAGGGQQQRKVAVLGFSLLQLGSSPSALPDALVLGTFVDDAGVLLAVSDALSAAGLVPQGASGGLNIGLRNSLYAAADATTVDSSGAV